MALVLVTGPALEPVSLEEAKSQLRIDQEDEDILVASLITAARIHLETVLGKAFITQHWEWWLDHWRAQPTLRLPLSPVSQLQEVSLYDDSGASQLVDPASYRFDGASEPPRLIWRQPLGGYSGIKLAFTAGYGADAAAVPEPLRRAILLLVAHWYENREPDSAQKNKGPLPPMVAALVSPYRGVRL